MSHSKKGPFAAINRSAATGILCLSLAACAAHDDKQYTPAMNDEVVKIYFSANGCPERADPEELPVDTSRFVVWRAVDASGDPIPMAYEIYFDPFKGLPIRSNPQGWKRSPSFDSNTPPRTRTSEVVYKYTIISDRCPDKPLDPRFRLRR